MVIIGTDYMGLIVCFLFPDTLVSCIPVSNIHVQLMSLCVLITTIPLLLRSMVRSNNNVNILKSTVNILNSAICIINSASPRHRLS